jgi:aldehyde dehydrogenase (NAD+)
MRAYAVRLLRLRRIEFSVHTGVNLVNVHLFVETMPFGGTGSAGIGHYYGKYGFDALTHAKSMLISPPDVAIEHLYSPFTEEKNRQLAGWFEY